MGVNVVALAHLGDTLTAAHAHNKAAGYRRGLENSAKNRLLIIDDDEDAAFSTCHSLKDGYEVDIAYDVLTGYKLWENKRHELVLLDLMLASAMQNSSVDLGNRIFSIPDSGKFHFLSRSELTKSTLL